MKKMFSVVALLLTVVLLLSACGKDDSKDSSSKSGGIEGTWKLTDVKSAGLSAEELKAARDMVTSGQMQETFVFKSGKATMHIKNASYDPPMETGYNLNYTLNGNKLSMTEEGTSDTQTIDCTISGNTMELNMDGGILVFTRQN